MTDSNQTIGKRIMTLRKQAGMTQEQLAERLGVSPQAVSKWENDVSCPDITMLPKIAEIFGVTTDTLLGVQSSSESENESSSDCIYKSEVVLGSDDVHKKAPHSKRFEGIGFGLMLIAIGAAFLISKFVDLPFDFFDILWPVLLLGWGVAGGIKHRAPILFGAAFIGLYYLLDALGSPLLFDLSWSIIWPIGLVLLGLNILTDKLFTKESGKITFHGGSHSYSDDNGFINIDMSFNSDTVIVTSPTVRGASVDISFGECTLDFTQCSDFADGAAFELDVSFGSCKILLPSTVRAVSTASSSFGAVEIKGQAQQNAKSIYIDGDVSFGNAEIRYI